MKVIFDINDRRAFWGMLNIVHTIIVASEGLLIEAAAATDERGLKEYFRHHLSEERGHAAWLARDLHDLGAAPAFDLDTAAIPGSQYYLVRHVDARALLGYMLALEGESTPIEMVDALEKAHGVGCGCLRHHAEQDPEHRKALMEMIEVYPSPWIGPVNAWTKERVTERFLTVGRRADAD